MNDLAEALNSEHWQRRVAALKIVQEKRLEISRFRAYPILLQSRLAQERYWLVRALAVSRQPHTYRNLLNFLDDPNPNVRSMAFYALGQQKNPQAIPSILEKIESSHNWYCQLYAYKALRSLGWKQTLSR
jgi:HEAT repeat protein